MGLISKTVLIKWVPKHRNYYESKGYIFSKYFSEFEVSVSDLPVQSHVKVDVKCDGICGREFVTTFCNYSEFVNKDKNYFCYKCKSAKNLNKEHISFEEWCLRNNRIDMLTLFDNELNEVEPSGIFFGSNTSYYFKCPQKMHVSEPKKICTITKKSDFKIKCNQCNSFAQININYLGGDFLEKYWDYDKNESSGIDPWLIVYKSEKKIWIKCQSTDYHGSYETTCAIFSLGCRCPYCSSKKVHIKDSLGQHIIDKFGEEYLNSVWSDKNEKSPFEYPRKSLKNLYWKCSVRKHKDYMRNMHNSYHADYRCPKCKKSMGENRIENFLLSRNIVFLSQVNSNHLHTRLDLRGVNNGLLSYDFYIPSENTLIEFQGAYHIGKGYNQTKNDLDYQQEHDKRKKEYAEQNNIKLLEIWYWDIDRVDDILSTFFNDTKTA